MVYIQNSAAGYGGAGGYNGGSGGSAMRQGASGSGGSGQGSSYVVFLASIKWHKATAGAGGAAIL